MCHEHILSKTPRARIDRTGAVVGSKALKYKFGDDTWINPAQTMQKVVITRDQLAAAGMPPAILELVPEEIEKRTHCHPEVASYRRPGVWTPTPTGYHHADL